MHRPEALLPPTASDLAHPMHNAAERGDNDLVQKLIDEGISVNVKDSLGQFPLHYASVFGREPVLLTLLKANADVNCVTKQMTTPLHYAARNNHARCVEILVKNGADVNAKDRDMWTPLHYACFRGIKTICTFLLEKGAGVNDKTKQGHTPLHLACTKGFKDVALELLAHNADCSILNNHQASPLQLLTFGEIPLPQVQNSLLPSIASLLTESLLSDVTIKVDGSVYRVHKCILATRCKFFLELFQQHPLVSEFEFSELSATTFKYFLEWVYTGSVSIFNCEEDSTAQVLLLLSFGHSYFLEELEQNCVSYIVKHLSVENIPKISAILNTSPNAFPTLADHVSVFILQLPFSLFLSRFSLS
ncbi:hypothetical protein Pelo_1339 [Pelomyxa schiedti]|nr:hypothetical protein Pelo_1339 [Pelomyxa schiedti]